MSQLNPFWQISATLAPVFPRPISPTVFLNKFLPIKSSLAPLHPFLNNRSVSVTLFNKSSISATACSATASAFPPVWLTTRIPLLVHASTSIVSYPAPPDETKIRFGVFDKNSSLTWKIFGTSSRAAETWKAWAVSNSLKECSILLL